MVLRPNNWLNICLAASFITSQSGLLLFRYIYLLVSIMLLFNSTSTLELYILLSEFVMIYVLKLIMKLRTFSTATPHMGAFAAARQHPSRPRLSPSTTAWLCCLVLRPRVMSCTGGHRTWCAVHAWCGRVRTWAAPGCFNNGYLDSSAAASTIA